MGSNYRVMGFWSFFLVVFDWEYLLDGVQVSFTSSLPGYRGSVGEQGPRMRAYLGAYVLFRMQKRMQTV